MMRRKRKRDWRTYFDEISESNKRWGDMWTALLGADRSCPHCGQKIVPSAIRFVSMTEYSRAQTMIYALSSPCCSKTYFVQLQRRSSHEQSAKQQMADFDYAAELQRTFALEQEEGGESSLS